MHRIAVLAEKETLCPRIAQEIARFCGERGLFPRIAQYQDQEGFFEEVRHAAPSNAVIALSGVDGLNAAEHLRALQPGCRIIWCSDLDFSLQAFRLRADDFMLAPVTPERLRQGLALWLERRNAAEPIQPQVQQ